MIYGKEPITFTIAQLGSLNRSEAENAVGLANQTQRGFRFEFSPRRFPLDRRRYGLPNSGFDLDAATRDLIQRYHVSRPLIVLTSAPYGVRDEGREADYFFFNDLAFSYDPSVLTISTYIWEQILGPRRLQLGWQWLSLV